MSLVILVQFPGNRCPNLKTVTVVGTLFGTLETCQIYMTSFMEGEIG